MSENVRTKAHHQLGKADSYKEVGRPVGAAGYRHGGWSRPLGEQLSHNEPGNGPWPHLEHSHEGKDCHDAEVTQ